MTETSEVKLPCVRVKQGKYELFGFAISARKLSNLVRINRKELDKDEGYQRVLSLSRTNSIAKYIDANNPIPNSILIAFDDPDVRVAPDKTEIYIPDKPDTGWVIDGQHRLAGAEQAKGDIDLFVIAFLGLSIVEQVRQFIVINREAVGVPTSLYYDLLKQLPPSKTTSRASKGKGCRY